MLKFDRRFENGTLRNKDVERQLQEDSPEPVFELLRKRWNVRIPSPKVRVVYKETDDFNAEKNYIEVGISAMESFRRVFERAGKKISGSAFLKATIGEKFSLLASMKTTPINWDADFCLYDHRNYTLAEFENFVSVATQISSIGEIGAREVERQLGVYDPVRNRRAFEILYEEFRRKVEPNEKKDRQEDKEVFRQLTQNDYKGLNPSKESRDKKAEKLKEDLDIMIQTAITGTAQLYVADIVEGKYHNALPSLMVKAFETNAQYVNCFENFVGKYMPTFAEKIEDVVPLFKQFMN